MGFRVAKHVRTVSHSTPILASRRLSLLRRGIFRKNSGTRAYIFFVFKPAIYSGREGFTGIAEPVRRYHIEVGSDLHDALVVRWHLGAQVPCKMPCILRVAAVRAGNS